LNRDRRSFAVAPLLLALLSAQGAMAAPEPLARLPLRPIGEHGLVLVEVTVGGPAGGVTKPFLVDTGGGLTAIAPDLAPAAGCTPAGRVTGFRNDGGRLDLPRCEPARLTIGGRERALETTILDLAAFGLRGVGGLVSLATFDGEAFTIDLTGRELVLESDASLAARTATMHELTVRAGRQAGGAGLDLFVAVNLPHGRLWLEFDSGNAGPLRLAPHAIAQLDIELTAENPDAPAPIELDFDGLGPTPVQAIRSEMIYDGLANARLFQEHVVTFDLRSGKPRAWIAKRAPETPAPRTP
jgi:hypothetical protein